MSSFWNVEYHSGDPIEHQGRRLTLFNRSVSFHLPGGIFNFVWNKPTSVLVSSPDGSEQILPIPNQTRRILIYMIAGYLFFGLFLWMITRSKA
jgi:hypothetical protein